MSTPVFPQSREADLLAWSAQFFALITAQPTRYSLNAAQATAYGVLHDAFATARAAAIDTNTNSKANIEAKNTTKEALLYGPGGAWQLVNIIQAAPATTNDMRVALNIRIPDVDPQPVPRPTEKPNIDLVSVSGYTITVRLHGDNVTGKPANVKGASLFTFVGPMQPTELTNWTFQGNTTKNTATLSVPPTTPPGSRVWVTAFWFNNRMESGDPTMPAVSVNIPGVMSQAA
jgi:hypothetical protein